ncbi:aldo/keto reductase [Afifella marina]|uniref:Predicted oxidoreductase n=1 Tax=Afifella marina DSM 2698 TaxID=1120955 RepID=A0A1G5NGZ0_AFIMA|nr:aldo/keto reductase [Afifella marina]MBK1623442.1 aldo/keto reductase [Afifella marina DSM 2698]MBK1626435.1 aldo/keto reductase [Afifella marina]MBK5917314.1 aldo/keto reductase [Afifella marina]RAI18036.1 aldo/keto reductase [Afifella marina DSM 2698]SCZ35860.1 Predicted oxidoreductase [Afifella marina DSM 2698]
MRYNPLGQTGLLVSELCFGTMTFGGNEGLWGKIGNLGQQDADALLSRALDAGVNFIDTANVYAEGRSETITGQALKNLGVARDEVVVATKFLGRVGEGPNATGASRYHILDQAKKSLTRLQLDHIDLYQIHGFDPLTPIEETLEALDTLVRHGHVRYVGVSNWAAWQIAKALGISERKNLAPFRSLQAYYTIAGRDLEREIVPLLTSEKVGLMVWSPLAGGFLSGKYSRDDEKSGDGRRATFDFPPVDKDRGYAVIDEMRKVAEAHSASVAQIALAWLLHQKVVTSVIIGAKRMDQLDDNLAAVEVRLSDDELKTLDQVSRLAPEYPGWMLERQSSYRQGEF